MFARELTGTLIQQFNEYFAETPPAMMAAGSIALFWLATNGPRLYQEYRHTSTQDIKRGLINAGYQTLVSIPKVGPKVEAILDKELRKFLEPVKNKTYAQLRASGFIEATMPEKGIPSETLLTKLDRELQAHIKPGRMSGGIYAIHDPKTMKFLSDVYTRAGFTNPLHSA